MKKNKNIKALTIYIFSLILFLFLPLSLAAAQNFGLAITPPLLEVMIKPGKTITQVYKLTNQGDDAQIYLNLYPFEPSDKLGNINLKMESSTSSLPWITWFSLQNTDIKLPGGFLLKSGETQELVLKIRVPENAKELDYYASLVFQVKPPENQIGFSGTQAGGILASNILLTVSKDGLPIKNGSITEFNALSGLKLPFINLQIFDSFDLISFNLIVKNTGKAVLKPLGAVKILNSKQKELEFIEVLPQNILVNSQRKLFAKGSEENILKEIYWQPRGLSLGKYQASAEFILSGSNNEISSTISFLIFPWKASLGFAIALMVISFIKKMLKK
ncbi:hypothetical protein ACFLZ1_03840 [Patescibacteria group bacterium]